MVRAFESVDMWVCGSHGWVRESYVSSWKSCSTIWVVSRWRQKCSWKVKLLICELTTHMLLHDFHELTYDFHELTYRQIQAPTIMISLDLKAKMSLESKTVDMWVRDNYVSMNSRESSIKTWSRQQTVDEISLGLEFVNMWVRAHYMWVCENDVAKHEVGSSLWLRYSVA